MTAIAILPSAEDLDAFVAEREQLRRARIHTYFMAASLHDGSCVQWYGNAPSHGEFGYACLICNQSAHDRNHIRHQPSAEHCQREFDSITAMVLYLRNQGMEPDWEQLRHGGRHDGISDCGALHQTAGEARQEAAAVRG